ncbi:MAG: hypothetical protein WC467_02145 [Patescibacteria group bacterium]
MKKSFKGVVRVWHTEWKKNRVYFWFFFVLLAAFAFTLVWTRLMIFEALRQNLVVSAGLKVENERRVGVRPANPVTREAKFLSLNTAQKNLDELNFLMSPNGQSVAYIFNDTKFHKKTLALNGQSGASYDDIFSMQFSASGQRFAYTAKVNGKSLAVIDGKEGKVYDWIFEPHFFTPDNQYFVYKARDSRGDMLVFNTWESQPYDRIYGVTVNNSKTELIFFARKGDQIWRGVVDLNKPILSNPEMQNVTGEGF